MVTISPATRAVTDGIQAYVVVPAVCTSEQKGTPMRAEARMTFVLKKDAGG